MTAQSHITLIGGLDPSGGAGLIRDELTCRRIAPSVPITCIASALTRQGRGTPAICTLISPAHFEQKLAEAPHGVWKIGMLPPDSVAPLVAELRRRAEAKPFVILDPIAVASDGGSLGSSMTQLQELMELVDLVTPNNDEFHQAGDIWQDLMDTSGNRPAFLVKGQRPAPAVVSDELYIGHRRFSFRTDEVPGPDPRGTGCALASAIAAAWISLDPSLQLASARRDNERSLWMWNDNAWVPTRVECTNLEERRLVSSILHATSWLDCARQKIHRAPDGRWHLDG